MPRVFGVVTYIARNFKYYFRSFLSYVCKGCNSSYITGPLLSSIEMVDDAQVQFDY